MIEVNLMQTKGQGILFSKCHIDETWRSLRYFGVSSLYYIDPGKNNRRIFVPDPILYRNFSVKFYSVLEFDQLQSFKKGHVTDGIGQIQVYLHRILFIGWGPGHV